MRLNLKIVRFTVSARLLFISDFDKEDFGEFIKGIRWCKSPALPERIVAFLKDADEVAPFNVQKVLSSGNLLDTATLGLCRIRSVDRR